MLRISIRLVTMIGLKASQQLAIAALGCFLVGGPAFAQTAPSSSAISSLELTPEKVSHLNAAVTAHDYVAAETLLLQEIAQDPHSARAGRLLAYAGSVYFLNQDYLNAAVAWKKSEAIAPLAPDLRFSLAMAYLRMGHSDWARPVLQSLATEDPKNAMYPYWLGRVAFEAQQYDQAIPLLQQATLLDPIMARAYDSLGLCYFQRNENEAAVKAFQKAIDLERGRPHPSAWPYMNLAATQVFLGRTQEAETNLREALRLDPGFAEAHYQLGTLLAHQNHPRDAVAEFQEAIRINPRYAEPHLSLAHIYREAGRKSDAEEEVKVYTKLHAVTNGNPAQ